MEITVSPSVVQVVDPSGLQIWLEHIYWLARHLECLSRRQLARRQFFDFRCGVQSQWEDLLFAVLGRVVMDDDSAFVEVEAPHLEQSQFVGSQTTLNG